MRKLFSSTLVALALAAAAPAFAASQGSGAAPHVANMTAQELLAYQDRIDRDLDKKQFDYVNSANRAKIEREQDVIRNTLAGHENLDELDENARMKVFNAHENVVAIMNDAERFHCYSLDARARSAFLAPSIPPPPASTSSNQIPCTASRAAGARWRCATSNCANQGGATRSGAPW